MPLPKLDVPTYELELPLSKKKIKYRPFLVKEQKNLLMAMESGESGTIQSAIQDILVNCTVTENIDIEKLPIVDIEYYFINLRARSVGEVVELKYRCNNDVGEKTCNNIMEVELNLNDIQVKQENTVSPEIQLNDQIVVKLKYPEFSVIKDSLKFDNINDVTFNMIASSIEYIYDGKQFHYAHEAQPGELMEFVESMNQEQFQKIENFFNNLPKLKETVEMTCSKCGFRHSIEAEGLESFFV